MRFSSSHANIDDPLFLNGEFVMAGLGILSTVYLVIAPGSPDVVILWILVALCQAIYYTDRIEWSKNDEPTSRIRRAVYVVAMAVTPALLHGATGAAIIATGRVPDGLWDAQLLTLDNFLLGWAFPSGQIGLWAQHHALFGVREPLGRLITEILQTSYMSYYIWGNLILLYFVYLTLASGARDPRWRRTLMMLYGWVAAYIVNFLINFAMPAISPRLHLFSQYTVPLEGYYLGAIFQDAIKSAAGASAEQPKSFGSFPSGHVALTWLAALSAHRMGFRRYSRVATVGACCITCAVVWLRYHYLVDALAAAGLVWTGLTVGRLRWDLQDYDRRMSFAPLDRITSDSSHLLGLSVLEMSDVLPSIEGSSVGDIDTSDQDL